MLNLEATLLFYSANHLQSQATIFVLCTKYFVLCTMAKESAGILIYRIKNEELEVFLVHPGGPLWSKKDLGVWSIPKGELDEEEDSLKVAYREFKEETGQEFIGNLTPLKPIRQKSGKIVHAWTGEGEIDESTIFSNTFEMEWPPKSGKMQSFPEVDKGGWFTMSEAKKKINPGQVPLLEELAALLRAKKRE